MTNSNETTDQEPSAEVAGRIDPIVSCNRFSPDDFTADDVQRVISDYGYNNSTLEIDPDEQSCLEWEIEITVRRKDS